MTEEQYRAYDALNFSLAKHLLKSPAHYQAALKTDVEPTVDMNIGSMVHAYFLEGKDPAYVLQPATLDDQPWHGGRKACKEWKAEQEKEGRIILNGPQELRQIRMIESLKASEQFQAFLDYSIAKEHVIIGEYRGVKIKGKLDMVCEDDDGKLIIPDLKKCPDASPRGWGKACGERSYRMQMEWYSTLLSMERGIDYPPYGVWCVIEDSEAAPVQFYRHTEQSAFIGRRQMDLAIDRYKQCQESGVWPAYTQGITDCPVNNWELREQ